MKLPPISIAPAYKPPFKGVLVLFSLAGVVMLLSGYAVLCAVGVL